MQIKNSKDIAKALEEINKLYHAHIDSEDHFKYKGSGMLHSFNSDEDLPYKEAFLVGSKEELLALGISPESIRPNYREDDGVAYLLGLAPSSEWV